MNFISDFSLFPIKHLGQQNWQYRKATWPPEVDNEVHKIINGKSDDPVYYNRTTIRDKRSQYCKISKQPNNDIVVDPGDGYLFLVRKDSTHNKEDEIDDSVIPHDMICVICLTNKRTHAVLECGHVSMCSVCAKQQYDTNQECPICRIPMSQLPIKLFFA